LATPDPDGVSLKIAKRRPCGSAAHRNKWHDNLYRHSRQLVDRLMCSASDSGLLRTHYLEEMSVSSYMSSIGSRLSDPAGVMP
jgi:hypothetical protein